MKVVIDEKSGFCFGVQHAIEQAEKWLDKDNPIFCLGDIVHNEMEVDRLEKKGLIPISKEKYLTLRDCTVLIRAHGEPADTYKYAQQNNIRLVEGTCPIVLKIQERIRRACDDDPNCQIIIFGKPTHPEVIGLNGQVDNRATIVREIAELESIQLKEHVQLFSQTTMDSDSYLEIGHALRKKSKQQGSELKVHHTICGQVANRGKHLQEFAKGFDAVVFVGGKKSSNSKVLFELCKEVNAHSYFVGNIPEVNQFDFSTYKTIGVCGATSTPMWLMKNIAAKLEQV